MPIGPDSVDETGSRGISEAGLDALRVAATLVHGAPDLRARLRSGADLVVEVGRADDLDGAVASGRWLSPCAFRSTVLDARRRWDEGVRLAMRGVAGDPDIEIEVPASGRSFPGGIVRVPCGGRWLFVFALCGDAVRFAPLVAEIVGEGGAGPAGRLGLRSDAALGTTLCFLEIDGVRPPDGPAVDLLSRLLARCTAEQVCAVPITAGG